MVTCGVTKIFNLPVTQCSIQKSSALSEIGYRKYLDSKPVFGAQIDPWFCKKVFEF